MTKTQQPIANPGMSLDPRNAKGLELNEEGKREFSHHFCDIFADMKLCFLGCCCQCFLHGQVTKRFEYLQEHNAPDPENGGSCCNWPCCLYALLDSCCHLAFILSVSHRKSVRDRYNISGNRWYDFAAACCCSPCEHIQTAREIELEEQNHPLRRLVSEKPS
ncbi:hypothetical protein CPC08DRAFT_649137 [Agrocybe pediades]|nr:hypothetical protein CPC08DRAFT_649137 [Agrocybe pediades]